MAGGGVCCDDDEDPGYMGLAAGRRVGGDGGCEDAGNEGGGGGGLEGLEGLSSLLSPSMAKGPFTYWTSIKISDKKLEETPFLFKGSEF